MKVLKKELNLETFRYSYHRAKKKEKTCLLNEFCRISGYERKYASRVLSRKRHSSRKAKKRGRKSKYDCPRFRKALKGLWRQTDYMCSKLLKRSIPAWLPYYELHFGSLEEDVREKLFCISPRSIDRQLKHFKHLEGRGRSGTKPGKMLRKEIPISTECWDTKLPGFVEADTVAHCGGSLMGNFVNSLTVVDIATTWTEIRGIWNKGAYATCEQIEDIENSLPFSLKGFDTDCGGEFINYHLLNYFREQDSKTMRVNFTRSRPYHKNDNAHVEQKNWSHARALLGYQRLGHQQLVPLINDLCKNEFSLLRNHFYPSFKIEQKIMVRTKHKRIYGDPITPYQRVMNSEHISQQRKEILSRIHQELDPIVLKRKIEQKLKNIFALLKKLDKKPESFKVA